MRLQGQSPELRPRRAARFAGGGARRGLLSPRERGIRHARCEPRTWAPKAPIVNAFGPRAWTGAGPCAPNGVIVTTLGARGRVDGPFPRCPNHAGSPPAPELSAARVEGAWLRGRGLRDRREGSAEKEDGGSQQEADGRCADE